MNRHPAVILVLSLTLLFSMTEIYKVTMLGFTVFTDAEKAARFCTCAGCSHSHGSMAKDESLQNDMQNMDHKDQNDKPSHCAMGSSESGKPSVCSCSTSSQKEIPILYNSLDKVALLAPVKQLSASEKMRQLFSYENGETYSLSKDIFHPPKAA